MIVLFAAMCVFGTTDCSDPLPMPATTFRTMANCEQFVAQRLAQPETPRIGWRFTCERLT